jgi:hypothetical protein
VLMARLQPCHEHSIQMRALAPEGVFLSALNRI